MGYTPASGDTATADTSSGDGGTFKASNPYTLAGVPDPLFHLSYGRAPYNNGPMPRAARGDEDFAGVQWGSGTSSVMGSNAQGLQSLPKLPPEQLANYQTLLQLAGYGPSTWNNRSGMLDKETLSAYNNLLQDVAVYQANDPNSTWTPDSYLAARAAAYAKSGSGAGRGGRGGGGGGGGSLAHTSTSRSYNIADPLAARAAAHDTFTNQLGRNPSKKETAAFTAALHAYERAHPSVSTTHTDASGNTSTTSTGGADENAFAQTYTSSTQDLANEQGTMNEVGFVNVLQKLIGG
jgi:hypothetical protein